MYRKVSNKCGILLPITEYLLAVITFIIDNIETFQILRGSCSQYRDTSALLSYTKVAAEINSQILARFSDYFRKSPAILKKSNRKSESANDEKSRTASRSKQSGTKEDSKKQTVSVITYTTAASPVFRSPRAVQVSFSFY
jgi:hypothetical protein